MDVNPFNQSAPPEHVVVESGMADPVEYLTHLCDAAQVEEMGPPRGEQDHPLRPGQAVQNTSLRGADVVTDR